MHKNLKQAIANGFYTNYTGLEGGDEDTARISLGFRVVVFAIVNVVPGKILKYGCLQIDVPGIFDTPMWAIDDNLQCWAPEKPGYKVFVPITPVELLRDLNSESRSVVRKTLGKKQEPPQWLVTALANNFSSSTFDLEQYDFGVG